MDRELRERNVQDDGRAGGEASPQWDSGSCFGDAFGHSLSCGFPGEFRAYPHYLFLSCMSFKSLSICVSLTRLVSRIER